MIGVEKMSEVNRGTASKILSRMMSYENETRYGATPTALAAMIARRYMHEYGLARDDLSLVPVKAHRNGVKNPLAHFQEEITVERVNGARIVADPLTLFDCCPTSDGAASIVLASDKWVRNLGVKDQAVRVLVRGGHHEKARKGFQAKDKINGICSRLFKAVQHVAGVCIKFLELILNGLYPGLARMFVHQGQHLLRQGLQLCGCHVQTQDGKALIVQDRGQQGCRIFGQDLCAH